MRANVFHCGVGIGDSIRIAAIAWGCREPDVPTIAFVADEYPGGLEVWRNLTFVDAVIPVSEAGTRPFWPADVLRPCLEVAPYGYPLRLDPSTFRVKSVPFDLPERFVAIQPSTHFYKQHVIPFVPTELPAVLLGTGVDRDVPWPGAIDLRGKLTIPEAMWAVALSERVVGAESWAAMLGGALGKATVQYHGTDTWRMLARETRLAFPTIEMREPA